MAGPSTALRFAQDDKVGVRLEEGGRAELDTPPFPKCGKGRAPRVAGGLFGHGLGDVVQAVGGVGDALEGGVLFAGVVVEVDEFVVAGVFYDEL